MNFGKKIYSLMGVGINVCMVMKLFSSKCLAHQWVSHLYAQLLHMTITLCNHPFTFYLPFHTYPHVDQFNIHAPPTCTMRLDPCAHHSLFWLTDPYYTVVFY